ncbi:MAG: response regulator transcription factor [Rhodocyclaceae bacterium]|nr:response regulator transcription factor [Rhodocyclaceae bacterium]
MSRLLVVDDHALVREGLAQALLRVPGVSSVMEAADAESALQMFASHGEFDLVLLDLMLPGISGLSFLGVLRKRYPGVRVVVVSALDGPEIVGRAKAGGAAGFVCKARPAADLVETVSQVLLGDGSGNGSGGEAHTAEEARPRHSHPYQDFGLTAAQCRVLDLLTKGKSNRDIAESLGLTEGTVKVHVTAILKALNVSNRTQALLMVTKSTMPL